MTDDALRVAVVGTGRMGGAMAGRIAAAGHSLTVWNRTRSKAEAVASILPGVSVVDTARDAAAAADVVVVSLADDAALRSAYGGDDGLIAGLRIVPPPPGPITRQASSRTLRVGPSSQAPAPGLDGAAGARDPASDATSHAARAAAGDTGDLMRLLPPAPS